MTNPQLDALDVLLAPIMVGVPTTRTKPKRAPWLYELAAREQLGLGDAWEVFYVSSIGLRGDTLVRGGVPTVSRSGARKWKGESQECVVTQADCERARASYEATAGMCGQCGGDGLSVTSTRVIPKPVTYIYRTCTRCNGSGAPVSTEAQA
jgi:hypothetical protein